jgi:hypothetical protein
MRQLLNAGTWLPAVDAFFARMVLAPLWLLMLWLRRPLLQHMAALEHTCHSIQGRRELLPLLRGLIWHQHCCQALPELPLLGRAAAALGMPGPSAQCQPVMKH